MIQTLALIGATTLALPAWVNTAPWTSPDTVEVMSKISGDQMETTKEMLAGTWYVQDLSEGPVPEGQQIVLEFDDTKMVAQTPCNRLIMTYDLSGNAPLFGTPDSSKIDCTAAQLNTERAFTNEVIRADRAVVGADGRLTVYVSDVIAFTAKR